MDILQELGPAISAAGIRSTIDLEIILLKLTPVQGTVWRQLRESDTGVETATLKARARCANLSGTAAAINAKLALAQDDRRITCDVIGNRAGKGTVGVWRIEVEPLDQRTA